MEESGSEETPNVCVIPVDLDRPNQVRDTHQQVAKNTELVRGSPSSWRFGMTRSSACRRNRAEVWLDVSVFLEA